MPRTVLVTGAARRIGAAIAERLARAGHHVVIHHRGHAEEADALAARLRDEIGAVDRLERLLADITRLEKPQHHLGSGRPTRKQLAIELGLVGDALARHRQHDIA